jgi:hypothetical protein
MTVAMFSVRYKLKPKRRLASSEVQAEAEEMVEHGICVAT